MTTETAQPATNVQQWHELAQQLRVDSIRSSTHAGSGHPTSSLSAADLMAVLMAKYLHYDFDEPHNPNNDHLIFSKGHASPLLYSMYKAAGVISEQEFMTYRQFGSMLEGHPTPRIPWVDVATGSLGQGFPIGVGVALAGKYLDKLPYHVWCLLGDSETAEGSVWEAFDKGSYYKLGNLIAIIDVNRLGQTGPTELGWDVDAYIDGVDVGDAHAARVEGVAKEERDGAAGVVAGQPHAAAAQVGERAHLAAVPQVLAHDQAGVAVPLRQPSLVGDDAHVDVAGEGVVQPGGHRGGEDFDLPRGQRRD